MMKWLERQSFARLAILAGLALLLLMPASLRHRYVWGGDFAELLHVFEFVSLLVSQGLGLLVLWAALRKTESGDCGQEQIIAIWRGAGWIALASLFVLPMVSDDVFAYDLRGRILALHGGNPYVDLATQYADVDPLVNPENRWHGYPNPYGPLFTLLQGGIAWTSQLLPVASAHVQQLASVLFYKLIAILALLWSARMLTGWAKDTASLQRVVLFVLWNPLLWLEGVVHVHNDLLLGATLVAALTSLQRDRFGAAVFWLWMGAQVKFVSLALGPLFFVLALRKRKLREFLLGNLVGGLPFALLGYAFWSGPGGLDWLTQQGVLQGASLQLLLMQLLGLAGVAADFVPKLLPPLAVAFALFAALRCRRVEDAPRWAVGVFFVLIFVGLIWVGPWYHLWWILLCWTPAMRLRAPALVLLVTGPLSYAAWLCARELGPTHEWLQWALTMAITALALALPRSKPNL
jgi:hypothetical protein